MNWFQMLHFSTASCFSSVLSRKALFCASVCQLWWKSCLVYWLNQSCSLPGLVSNIQKDSLLSLVILLLLSVLWQSVDHTKHKSAHGSNKCCIYSSKWFIWHMVSNRTWQSPQVDSFKLCNLWTDWFSPKFYVISTSFKFLKYNFRYRRIWISFQ